MPDSLERLRAALDDRYRIEREVGSGGMATVYLAEDLRHHRKVAVKVLRPDLAATLGPERFLREIEVAARLTHPHILPLHDSGEAGGFLFYVMPYIEGESLREKLAQDGALPVSDAVRILRDVVDALASAHKHGVVHRDVKPDNVLLLENHALVTDFGVAKAVSEATGREKLTTAGVALGTPAYMAPEQAVADPHIDHRADIYAVGVVAYELLTGRPPFTGDTAQIILSAHVTETPEPVTKHRDTVPAPLAELVMKCLAKKPADRWQSAEQLLPQLEALATPSGGVTPTATRPLTGLTRARPRAPLAVVAAGALVIAAGAVWWTASRPGDVELDPNLVAVFPFRISGDQQLDYLGEGVVDLLQGAFTGDGGPRAVSSQTAISAWKRSGGSAEQDLTEDEARTVASSLGAGLLLQGSIVASPTNLVLNASLLPVAGDDDPVQATVSGSADSVAVLTSRLTAQLLSLRAGEESQRVSGLAHVSLPALRAYLQGQIALRESRYEDALAEFGRALAIDSTFALAGLAHSIARGWVLGGPPSPGPRIAWQNRNQLSGRDQLLLESCCIMPGAAPSYAERLAQKERVATTLGDRPEAWYLLGDYVFHRGPVMGMSREQTKERAWAAFQRGLDLDPDFGPILTHKFDQAIFDEDATRLRQLVDSFPDILAVDVERSLATAIVLHDSNAVQRWRDGFSGHSDAELAMSGGYTFALGRVDDAFQAVRELVRRTTTADQRWDALRQQRQILWGSGQPRAAAELTVRMSNELRPVPHPNLWELVFAALFENGDTVQAREAIRELEASAEAALGPDPIPSQQVRDICYAGVWYADRGNGEASRRMLTTLRGVSDRAASNTASHVTATSCQLALEALLADAAEAPAVADRLDSLALTGPFIGSDERNLLSIIVAGVFESQGRLARALAAVRRPDQFAGLGFLPMLREEGRLALLTGDTTGAIWAYDWYLRVRDQAEPSVRARDDAIRADLARLVGERGN